MTELVTALMADFKDKGLQPRLDDDGDIALTHSDMTYVLCFSESDVVFSTLILPNFYELQAEEEVRILPILNDINQRFKWLKGVVKQGNVSFMVEFWMMDEVRWSEAISRCLRLMNHALVLFADAVHNGTPAQTK